ncbi:MAG: IS4 family transposase [Symploca sp. SIO2E6]|nr:IS4 family transposase [Symploca sp. SIO2E6]
MMPKLYRNFLCCYLSESQILTLDILIWLLQVHKQVKIERLAACFPLPILYESRRRHIQRFLISKKLNVTLIWLPLIQQILLNKISAGSPIIVSLDRTQWQVNNLLMVTVIWKKRALPVYWKFLEKKGSSNLDEQIAVIRPVLRLLKRYQIIVIGDREFRSVELAYWLKSKKVYFAFRQKQDTYIRQKGKNYQLLSELGLTPGTKFFYTGVNYTKRKGFGKFSLAGYWKRKYRGKLEKSGWYILTNLTSFESAIKAYKARSGIEAMFKDCKTGGYNIEGSKASIERLTRLVMLIAMAYVCAVLEGEKFKRIGQQKYINRIKELGRYEQRHSNFWVGIYGINWIISIEFCRDMVNKLMSLSPNKLSYFQRGLRAMSLIELAVL